MTARTRFILRYSLSQLTQSVVWSTQQPNVIAKAMGINPAFFYATPEDAPPRRTINLKRLTALRGAVAGSVIISQVFSLMDVISLSMQAYSERIRVGKEPPLEDDTRKGVVVRLAGENSIVTNLSLARGGRRRIFPIYENPNDPDVEHMVEIHSSGQNGRPALLARRNTNTGLLRRFSTACATDVAPSGGGEGSPFHNFLRSSGGSDCRVPVYWKVDDGRYSHSSSWAGMNIPPNWFFDLPDEGEELLLLEADATLDYPMSLRRVSTEDFDLDLKEVAQGFSQLINLATKGNRHRGKTFQTMRVLLVDPDAASRSGGGRETTAREVANELGLADIVVDARAPIVITIKDWLASVENRYGIKEKKPVSNGWWRLRGGSQDTKPNKPIVLETPEEEWFLSLQGELGQLGYTVMDRVDALNVYGSLDGIPFIVYEKTTGDTLHTVSQLVRKGMVEPQQVCAFCPRPWALEALMENSMQAGVRYISSADIYDRLLHWVRTRAIEDGATAEEIQQELDNEMVDILEETAKHYDGLVRIVK
eukprot:CAMPEP_0194047034 /NCGR_PEP_ID=MMETSP0009_2-20130614/23515_1 /TAXON_ID=210454 /ORGANISM="Grammatophora oceanica, Strain CCMP 410" /LENGTH=534 /DNA_ID=CAMNT_0038692547 /DNA_START=167 /DNA_END=1771 /DNA_ORIENTATION=-